MVERNLAKVEVAGSSPVSRSIFLGAPAVRFIDEALVNMNPASKIAQVLYGGKGLKSTSQSDYIADTFFKTNTHISLDELSAR